MLGSKILTLKNINDESPIKRIEKYLDEREKMKALPTIDGDMAYAWRTGLKQRIESALAN